MKKLISALAIGLFLIVSSAIKSQEYLDFNTGQNKTKQILLVPFDPRIYVNDATSIILKKEKGSHDELMQYFRYQFNLQLSNAMMDSCTVISLFTDNTRQDQDDIDGLYSIISYELRPAMKNRPENREASKTKGYFATKREEKAELQRIKEIEESKSRIQQGEITGKPRSVDDMFLHIVFNQTDVLAEIASRRNIDLFMFINQFEIKGNYGDPYLTGNKKAERTIKVHFSLYNSKGNHIHGSFGSNMIPFDIDTKEDIVNLYFPEVIRQIIHNIDF
jgi:hypothetical protein